MRLELERRESWLLILHIVCHSVGVYFIPLVFETVGGWNDDAVKNWSLSRLAFGSELFRNYTSPVPTSLNFVMKGKCFS